MIRDARAADRIDDADVCIVGAGAAGIALALELEEAGRRVLLVEAGGLAYDAAAQQLLAGESHGDRFPPLRETRMAALGGSTAVWAGYCRPLDDRDFDAGDGSPGWPLRRADLAEWYRRAADLCAVPPIGLEAWNRPHAGDTPPLPGGDDSVANVRFQIHRVKFGSRYGSRLQQSRDIEVLLHAPAARLHLNESGSWIESLEVRPAQDRTVRIRAKRFVLATGGIENARLLLASGTTPERAPGNDRGLVGRYFTDHPFVDPGVLVLANGPASLDAYLPHSPGGDSGASRERWAWSLSPATLQRERCLNGALLVCPRYECHQAFARPEVKDFLSAVDQLRGHAVPGTAARLLWRSIRAPRAVAIAALRRLLIRDGESPRWRLRAMFEAESHFENRVTLDSRVDALGRPRARVDWRLGERDIASMGRFVTLVDAAFRRTGFGHIELAFPDEPAAWRAAAIGGKHHMGTTRMHLDPSRGVVDETCRVHGTDNLYIAGSSVFTSGGYSNPTLTIIALAARLAHHLRGVSRGAYGNASR